MPNVLPATFDPLLVFPERPDGYVIWAIFMLLTLGALIAAWRTFSGLSRSQWVGFFLLLVISVPLNSLLVLPLTAVMPQSSLPGVAQVSPISLLGLLGALLAGAWMGIGPAIVVGFASGAARWLLAGGRVTQPAEIALFAAIAAICMQQNYRGWLGDVLRRPLLASAVASVAALLLSFLAIYATAPGDELSALDYASTLFVFTAVPVLAEGLLNGLLTHVACLAFPTMRRQRPAMATPFYAHSLNRRLLITILPITFVTISFQVIFVSATALEEARRQTIAQLSHSAQAAVELVDSFFVEGPAVLAQFAADDRLQDVSPIVRQARLSSAIRTVAFFDEMMLVDRDGKILNSIRVGAPGSPGSTETSVSPPELTTDETDLLKHVQTSSAPLRTGVQREANGSGMVSFMQPIGGGSSPQSILIGRTRLAINPLLNTVRRNLAGKGDFGVGYLIDDGSSRIIVHPDPGLEMTQWIFDRSQKEYITDEGGGKAYIDLSRDNTRRFMFVQEVSGTPWLVAIELPYRVVLGTAAQISTPLVVLFAVIMVGALVLIPFVTRRITQPLGTLAQAAGRIAQGELDRPVQEVGEDEVGQLGVAFEGMRQSLKARVDDLSLLLRVSESVAASLDLERGITPILAGAMQAAARDTHAGQNGAGTRPAAGPARVARLIMFDDNGQPSRVLAQGEGPLNITLLDVALADVTTRNDRPLLIENVARSHGALDPNLVGPGVRSIAALPLRRSARALGIMWLGYPEPRPFSESEVALLVTLAGQVAVFIENAGLFEAAEGGRQRLQAVLSSTNDAVLVTDRESRILLCNPSAEIAFGVPRGGAVGRLVSDVIADQHVVDLLAESDDAATRTAEIAMPDGRTLYGSASLIVSADGQRIGRVAVLRDITHLKELDVMKNEFVATVSHDLRAPLTYMRGYLTMIPMTGSIAPKQEEYLNKIMGGIEQMTALIDDLLDLGRIDAGVGIVREPTAIADLILEAVESMQPHAAQRKQKLLVEALADRTIVGDRQLLKHAVSNLIDNAIKYTPAGGMIRVGVDEHDGQLVVRVSDNGIGIAPADQVRLFEKFYRVKRRDTLDIRGTGLGLAIVKSIAGWHHGRVWVESQMGQGSTFYLALPIASPEESR